MIVDLLIRFVLTALLCAGVLAFTVLAVDALEWETTGACKDCVLLPYTAERFQ